MPLAPPTISTATAVAGDALFEWLLRTTWQAAVLVAFVGAAHLLIGRRLAPRWRFALWGLVVARLLLPALPTSAWSVFNFSPFASLAASADHRVTAATQSSQPTSSPSRLAVSKMWTDFDEVAVSEKARNNHAAAWEVGSSDAADDLPAAAELVTVPSSSRGGRAAPAPPLPVAPTATDWRQLLLFAWFAGALLLAGQALLGAAAMRRRLRGARTPDRATLDLLDRCRRELGLRAAPPVLLTDAVAGPVLYGFVRPVLLLPPALGRALAPAELRFVFLHELAHLKRHDPSTNAALLLAGALHWFNPLAWLAVARCRVERELACDEVVLAATAPDARQEYGRAVLRVAEWLSAAARRGGPGRGATPALGMASARSPLRRRIAMIASFHDTPRRAGRSVLPAVLLLGICSCALTDRKRPAAPGDAPTAATTQEGSTAVETARTTGAAPTATPTPAADQAPTGVAPDGLIVRQPDGQTAPEPPADAVIALIRTCRDLIIAGRHAEALAVVDRILAIEPDNDYAVGVRPLIVDRIALLERRARDEQRDRDDAARPDAPDPEPSPALRAKLDRPLPDVKLDNLALTDALDFLEDVASVEIETDWKALADAGVERDARVIANLQNVKLANALRLILDVAGGDVAALDYAAGGDVIRVSTRQALGRVTTRVYDVRDLLTAAGADADEPPDPVAAETRRALLEELATLIKEAVDPASWRGDGPVAGDLRELRGQFVVTQSRENHRQIIVLLEQLRETRGPGANARAAAPPPPPPPARPAARPPKNGVAFDAPVGALRASGMEFTDVIDAIRDATGQNIFVNWRALKLAKVKRELPVTVDLSGLTLAEALQKLLTEVGGTHVRLGYTVDDGVVTISTVDDLARNTLTRVYDIRKAIKGDGSREQDVAAVVRRIRGIDPLSWRDDDVVAGAAGPRGSRGTGAIRELQGQLIVTQTHDVHRRIMAELGDVLPPDVDLERLESAREPALWMEPAFWPAAPNARPATAAATQPAPAEAPAPGAGTEEGQ
jgi:beta-lactamase regulating signal transducer with metallopeptidase domain